MRLKLIYMWMCTAATLAAACIACGNDGLDYSQFDNKQKETYGFLSFQINTPQNSQTRAESRVFGDDFNDGDENEYALVKNGTHHFAILYYKNSDNKNNDNTKPALVASLSDYEEVMNDDKPGITKTLYSEFTLSKEEYPSEERARQFLADKECIVLLNTDYTSAALADKTKSQLKSETSGGFIDVGGTRYFTMSSSAYVSGNQAQFASEINPGRIFDTKEEAREAAKKGDATIVVYVERVVAKYNIQFSWSSTYREPYLAPPSGTTLTLNLFRALKNDGTFDHLYDTRNYRVKLLGYGLNGLEQYSLLLKDIKANTYFNSDGVGWNDANHHRSYWSEDPHYPIEGEVEHYPHQYRHAMETAKGGESDTLRSYLPRIIDEDYEGYKDFFKYEDKFWDENSDYYLKYVTFDNLLSSDNDLTRNRPTMYSFENTYDDSSNLLGDRGYFTAGTHLLVACQLEIQDSGWKTYDVLYKDQNDIFYDDADELIGIKLQLLVEKALPGGNPELNIIHTGWLSHSRTGSYVTKISWPADSKLYVKNDGTIREAMYSDFKLIHAELTGGDGQVMIAPANADAKFYICPTAGDAIDRSNANDSTKSTEITPDELISLFHKLMGAFDCYRSGYMYYAAPICHVATRNTDATSREVGSVGAVRNHEYHINVNSVSQPGSSVDSPGQPIIPLIENKRDYIDVSVEILDWHPIIQDNIPMSPTQ